MQLKVQSTDALRVDKKYDVPMCVGVGMVVDGMVLLVFGKGDVGGLHRIVCRYVLG